MPSTRDEAAASGAATGRTLPPAVLIIGAQGVLGGLTAEIFKTSGWNVLRGGRRKEASPDFRFVDLDVPQTLVAATAGVHCIVNSVEEPNLTAERYVLKHGGLLLNMATVARNAREQLCAKSSGAKGLVVFGAGYSGFTSIVARALLTQHPDADAIDLAYTVSLKGMSGRSGAAFGHRVLTEASRRQVRRFDFGAPIGERTCMEISFDNEGWLHQSVLGDRKARMYLTLTESVLFSVLLWLDRRGLLRKLPRAMLRANPPRSIGVHAATKEPMHTWIGVSKGGRSIGAYQVQTRGDYLTTARIAEQFARKLSEKYGAGGLPPGVCSIEEVFELGEVSLAAEEAGIRTMTTGKSTGP